MPNGINKRHAHHALYLYAGQNRLHPLKSFGGQGHVEGDRNIIGLLVIQSPIILELCLFLKVINHCKGHPHKRFCFHADLTRGLVFRCLIQKIASLNWSWPLWR